MSGAGNLDLRLPIGGLFTINGLILAAYGLATTKDSAMYARSAGININLVWGVVMLVFGLVMLLVAWRGRPTLEPAERSPEGRATEEREHERGLEH